MIISVTVTVNLNHTDVNKLELGETRRAAVDGYASSCCDLDL